MLGGRLAAWWRAWRQPRGQAGPAPAHVVMYTRRGCHLCEDAWQVLLQAARRHSCRLEAVDIDADPDLRAKYGHEVPVVAVNGRVHFRGRVNPVLLDRTLRAAAR